LISFRMEATFSLPKRGRLLKQGCQLVYFKTKYPNLNIFWRALESKILVYFTAVRCNSFPFVPFGIIYGRMV
jgi:hypothetical protein